MTSAIAWWGRTEDEQEALTAWAAGWPSAWSEPTALHAVAMAATVPLQGALPDPAVLSALALAARAPMAGHVCVALDTVEAPEDHPDAVPSDRAAWRDAVAACPLVGGPDSEEPTPWVLEGWRLYPTWSYGHEVLLARSLGRRLAAPAAVADPALLAQGLRRLFPPPKGLGRALDRQQLAAAMAVLREACVISGGPGTGKTWTVRHVLTLVVAQWLADPAREGLPRIAVAAPTGKAAARVVQSIRAGLDEAWLETVRDVLPPGAVDAETLRALLDGLPPWTLHRLLGWQPASPTRFRHHADNPLPFEVVVVDEASMVDAAMMSHLVDAVHPDARLVLLGDRHQLASVEAGTVLADLCGPASGPEGSMHLGPELRGALGAQAGIEVEGRLGAVSASGPWDGIAFLTRSRRFDARSGVGHLARACVAGDADGVLTLSGVAHGVPGALVLDDEGRVVGPDVFRVDPTPTGRLPRAVAEAVLDRLAPVYGLLASGPAAGDRVAWLRSILEAAEAARLLCAHRQGALGVDGVVAQLERGAAARGWVSLDTPMYVGRPVLITQNDPASGRFNGDVGMVVPSASGQGVVVAFDRGDGQVDEVSPARLPAHETVFAMTIHKSQGSEHDDVVVVLPARPSAIVTRELLYTGVTRARKRVTVVGTDAVLEAAVRSRVVRATGLADRLGRPPTDGA